MRSLAGSVADGVLADTILIPPYPLIPLTNTRKVRCRRKKYENHEKKGDVGMAKRFSTKVRKQGMSFQLPCTCNPNENYVKMDYKIFSSGN